jgi:hypothetical protein
LVQAGAFSLFGTSLADAFRLEPQATPRATKRPGRAKAVVLIAQSGGPSQHEAWSPKPDAPAEIRDEYGTTATPLPGVRALAEERPDNVASFVQTARRGLCRKANDDTHEYMLLAAILEDAAWVSPSWRPRLLAAGVHYFHGTQTADNPVIRHVPEALRHQG